MEDDSPVDRHRLAALLRGDRVRMRRLAQVAALNLPDGWIGAGMVRNAVWDHLHGRPPGPIDCDVDVVWFDRNVGAEADRRIEAALSAVEPTVVWSVKNQARMHLRNGDAPYASTVDALSHWPDTATAVAARCRGDGIDILSPFGLHDLFSLTLRPTPAFTGGKRSIFDDRVAAKHWLTRWPRLRLAALA